MTLNYFVLTKDGADLGDPGAPLAPGVARSVAARAADANALGNPSFEANTTGWAASSGWYTGGDESAPAASPAVTLTRVTTDHAPDAGGTACAQVTCNDAQVDFLVLAPLTTARVAVSPGETWTHSAYAKGQTTSNRQVGIVALYFDASGAFVGSGTAAWVAATGTWQRVTRTEVVPAGAAFVAAEPQYSRAAADPGSGLAVGEWGRFDGVMSERSATLSQYVDADAPALAVVGAPADLDARGFGSHAHLDPDRDGTGRTTSSRSRRPATAGAGEVTAGQGCRRASPGRRTAPSATRCTSGTTPATRWPTRCTATRASCAARSPGAGTRTACSPGRRLRATRSCPSPAPRRSPARAATRATTA